MAQLYKQLAMCTVQKLNTGWKGILAVCAQFSMGLAPAWATKRETAKENSNELPWRIQSQQIHKPRVPISGFHFYGGMGCTMGNHIAGISWKCSYAKTATCFAGTMKSFAGMAFRTNIKRKISILKFAEHKSELLGGNLKLFLKLVYKSIKH